MTVLLGAVAAGIDTTLPTGGGGTFTEIEDTRDPEGQILTQTCYLAGGGAAVVSWTNPAPYSGPTVGAVVEVPLPGAAPAGIRVTAVTASLLEGNAGNQTLSFLFQRTGLTGAACSCTWQRSGTINATDLVSAPTSGPVSFAAGVATPIQLDFQLRGDLTIESDETLTITCTAPVGCVIEGGPATTTVLDEDTPTTGFVQLVQMEIDKPERAGDIIVPTFNATINGYYIRIDPDTRLSDPQGVRPIPTTLAPYAPPNDDLNNPTTLCANTVAAAANKIYDFRGRTAVQHNLRTIPGPNHGYQYTVWESTSAGANSVICGGKTHTVNADWLTDPWAEIHGNDKTGFNAPGIWITAAGNGSKWQGFYLKDTQDGIQPRAENWVIENAFVSARDDVIENDDQYSGVIRNAYLQGHVLLSVRPEVGSRTENNLHCIVTFEYCLIRMKRQPNDGDEKAHNGSPGADYGGQQSRMRNSYTNPTDPNRHDTVPSSQVNSVNWFAHKGCFKSHVKNTTQNLYEARVHMRNCIIIYEAEPVEGTHGAYFPGAGDGSIVPGGTHTGSRYENVTLCVVAPGGWNAISDVQTAAELTAMGITVINPNGANEQAAYDAFTAAETEWFATNDYNSTSDTFAWNRT